MTDVLLGEVDGLVEEHQKVSRAFKELIVLSQEVDRVCKNHIDVPKDITNFLIKFWVTLEALTQKEEKYIFPSLIKDIDRRAYEKANEALRTHSKLKSELKVLVDYVLQYKVNENSCELWKELVNRTTEVVTTLEEHLNYEGEIFALMINSYQIYDGHSVDIVSPSDLKLKIS
ncbi:MULTISPECIES: hemerythrin domain-containing protein [unclassified Halobacteriovorax]|uniref:hemerythrin domain-containing protein n=1 Tax=unclassified Halobacteriovorax TaxID=2639665 RepID=UPI00399A2DFA